jgi:hypothetical protein
MAIQQQSPALVSGERAPVAEQPRYNYRAAAAVGFIAGLVDVLIAGRFLLKLLGASAQSSFVNLIYGISSPLVAPFHGIFPSSGSASNSFEPAALVAIAVYSLIGWGAVVLIRIATAPHGSKPEVS